VATSRVRETFLQNRISLGMTSFVTTNLYLLSVQGKHFPKTEFYAGEDVSCKKHSKERTATRNSVCWCVYVCVWAHTATRDSKSNMQQRATQSLAFANVCRAPLNLWRVLLSYAAKCRPDRGALRHERMRMGDRKRETCETERNLQRKDVWSIFDFERDIYIYICTFT